MVELVQQHREASAEEKVQAELAMIEDWLRKSIPMPSMRVDLNQQRLRLMRKLAVLQAGG